MASTHVRKRASLGSTKLLVSLPDSFQSNLSRPNIFGDFNRFYFPQMRTRFLIRNSLRLYRAPGFARAADEGGMPAFDQLPKRIRTDSKVRRSKSSVQLLEQSSHNHRRTDRCACLSDSSVFGTVARTNSFDIFSASASVDVMGTTIRTSAPSGSCARNLFNIWTLWNWTRLFVEKVPSVKKYVTSS